MAKAGVCKTPISGSIPLAAFCSRLSPFLLTLLLGYLWILPLYRPHGPYGWGRYTLVDLYLGIPLALGAVAALGVRMLPRRRRRSAALRVAAALGTGLLTLALLDVLYASADLGRFTAGTWINPYGVFARYNLPDPELRSVRKPHLRWRGRKSQYTREIEYRTDENGFRNPSGLTRAEIAFIGDSMTEATEVSEEDGFVRRVERAVGRSVVNLGRTDYGPQQEVVVLRRYALGYHPRRVVWQLYEGNDMRDAERYLRWRRAGRERPLPLKAGYTRNSLLAQLFERTSIPDVGGSEYVTAGLDLTGGGRAAIPVRADGAPDPARYPEGWREVQRSLAEGQKLCRERRVELVILFLPALPVALRPSLTFETRADEARALPACLDRGESFRDRLANLCQERGLSFVDPLPALRAAASRDNREILFPFDGHLDRAGHAVVAREIAAALSAP